MNSLFHIKYMKYSIKMYIAVAVAVTAAFVGVKMLIFKQSFQTLSMNNAT